MVTSKALQQLVKTVNATGGVIRILGGYVVPRADEEWIDLGMYIWRLGKELGVEPRYRRRDRPLDDS